MKLPFWKLQSIGNDFPLIHLADAVGQDLVALSVRICDRRRGVGGDGLLGVEMEGADLRLRMFNPDGTEDFCGNGIRCAARHVFDAGWVGSSFNVLHLGKKVPTVVVGTEIHSILGSASYEPKDVPHTVYRDLFNCTIWSGMVDGFAMSLFGSSLTTGSTHTIITTDSLPDDDSFNRVSPLIENDPRWPQRTSVIWCKVVAPMHLQIRIWERGVGETLGCGTGSSAAAADYMRRKGVGGLVRVDNRGGTVTVQAENYTAPLTLTGTAQAVYSGWIIVPTIQPVPSPNPTTPDPATPDAPATATEAAPEPTAQA